MTVISARHLIKLGIAFESNVFLRFVKMTSIWMLCSLTLVRLRKRHMGVYLRPFTYFSTCHSGIITNLNLNVLFSNIQGRLYRRSVTNFEICLSALDPGYNSLPR